MPQSGRRVLALGDMRELGEGADAFHAGLADAVAASGATQAVKDAFYSGNFARQFAMAAE